jgi:hypothetical protein
LLQLLLQLTQLKALLLMLLALLKTLVLQLQVQLKMLLAQLKTLVLLQLLLLLAQLKTLLLLQLLLLLTLLKLLAPKLLTQLRSNTSSNHTVCCKANRRLLKVYALKNRSSQDVAVFLRLLPF